MNQKRLFYTSNSPCPSLSKEGNENRNQKNLKKLRHVIGSLFFLCIAFSVTVFAEKAEVRYVIDGDTFILENNQRVRMIGINAPETSHKRYGKEGQAFGNESKRFLKRVIEGKEVDLHAGKEGFDRFGRRLAYVYLQDGTFVNEKMVELGYAETFRKFPFEFKEEFLKLESNARNQKLGMWQSVNEDGFLSFTAWFKNLLSGE